jgi:hypothetical protein
MRVTIIALSIAWGVYLAGCQSTSAALVSATAMKEAAAAVSAVQRTRYAYRRTKHGTERCYHRSRFGSRRSHWQRWWSSVPDC